MTMQTEKRNFLGIPVEGEIAEGSTRVEQKPIEELQPTLEAILNDETIVEFGWKQFTPYFRDGDPCEFGINGVWFKTIEDAENLERWEVGEVEFDYYELDFDMHSSLGKIHGHWDEEQRKYVEDSYEGPDESRYRNCKALNNALMSGAFENILIDAFGDHALITVRRDGIEIEFYEHD
jgi:hypothetical protein